MKNFILTILSCLLVISSYGQENTTSKKHNTTTVNVVHNEYKIFVPTDQNAELCTLTEYSDLGEYVMGRGIAKVKFHIQAGLTTNLRNNQKFGFLRILSSDRPLEFDLISFSYDELDKCIEVFKYMKEEMFLRLNPPKMKYYYETASGETIILSNNDDLLNDSWQLFIANRFTEVQGKDFDFWINTFTIAKQILDEKLKQ